MDLSGDQDLKDSAASPGFRREPEGPAMGFDDLPGDRQAKAAASLGAGLIAHRKRGEQILAQGFGNAVAIVRQAQQDSGAGLDQRDPDAGAQPVVPQGVAEDIVQGSAHLEGVQTAGKAQGFRNIMAAAAKIIRGPASFWNRAAQGVTSVT